MSTALLAGATGLVGGHVLTELLASPHYAAVIAVGRRSLELSHPKLRQITADLLTLSVDHAAGANDVFCCLGTTLRKAGSRDAFRQVDFEMPFALARAARAAGATRYCLVSSLGAHPRGRTFYLRVKGELEQALEGFGFPSLLLVRPSLLLGDRAETRMGERLAEAALRLASPALRGRWRKYRGIEARVVARAMVRLAEQGVEGRRVVESDEIARLAEIPRPA